MGVKQKIFVQWIAILLVSFLCGQFIACTPKERTQIRFWHAYTGEQAVRLQELVAAYNQTVGQERNVEVLAYYKGSIQELSQDLNRFNLGQLPNVMEASEDAAYLAYLSSRIVGAEEYLSQTTLTQYSPGFLDSGKFTVNGNTYIFPLESNLDVLYLNANAFNTFKQANPSVKVGNLHTWEGLYNVAAQYYAWTDQMTPDQQRDGKSFVAIESVKNYLFTVANQYASSIVQPGNKGVQIVLNYETLGEIWAFFYGGALRGYVSVSEDSVNKQMEEGQLVCYLASTASARWVPATYRDWQGIVRSTSLFIEEYPSVTNSRLAIPHDVRGVVVVDTDPIHNAEAYAFLDWLCSAKEGYGFYAEGSSLPVHQAVLQDTQIHQNLLNYVSQGRYPYMSVVYSQSYTHAAFLHTYHPAVFYGSEAFAQALADSLLQAAREGKMQLEAAVQAGMPYTDALAAAEDEAYFQAWIQQLEAIRDRY